MPQRKKAAKGPTPIEALTHEDKRINIPTADAQDFLDESVKLPVQLRYARDPDLDPQLVWKGKDAQDSDDLMVEVPPLFIQEKVDPRVLIENLRRTATKGETEPELTLFDTFDGLSDWESVEYYKHASNWSNRLILGDSLQVMASLAERESLRAQVQMIYIDPPYGIKFGSNWQATTRKRDVKDGNLDDATREVEQIKAFRDTWELGINSYLSYLRDRLVVARDLLTESGSVFVQIGDENVHLVRAVMDEVFGSENFAAQITFKTTTGAGSFSGGTNVLAAVSNFLVWYAKDLNQIKYRQLYRNKIGSNVAETQYTWVEMPDGTRRQTTAAEREEELAGARFFSQNPLTSQTTRTGQTTVFPVEFEGKSYVPSTGGWKTNRDGMSRLLKARRVMAIGKNLRYVRFMDDFPAYPYNNVWEDTITSGFGDAKTYVVQTNAKVIERCLLMTTDPGDVVVDPTCGSGTTAVVAEQWGRRWITMDTSRVALTLARQRLMGAKFPHYLLSDSAEGAEKEFELSGQVRPEGVHRSDVRQGFVLKRVPHVTLKSIANNPDLGEGMSVLEIRDAIARHSDTELLHDMPFEDSKRVRVTGPFTVESLSPYRAVAASAEDKASRAANLGTPADAAFDGMLLANLLTSGVQSGRKDRRFEFDAMEPMAGRYLVAQMVPKDAGPVRERVAVTVGPRYGTVGADWIKGAAREALRGEGFDVLLVLGFAFDPLALETVEEFRSAGEDFELQRETRVGGLRILLVRMNADLAMGEKLLKKSKNANLFTVFGEPDIRLEHTPDGWRVEVVGFDVYNPVTGEVVSGNADDIAMWMVDSDYDEESFFVRHAYFPGRQDPYTRLKRALKADIDESAWETLNSTTSRPFPTPSTGKIAVKVVNDYGDEVMRVLDVPAAK
jgi:adenine-specific DNA-methyltransferase